jgi:gamma-glutamylcyclotransferase (GGCT)/AIG2-like uncharacterized protein YtfP
MAEVKVLSLWNLANFIIQMRVQYLFSYGTLQQEEVQSELFGRPLQGSTDVLLGYTIKQIKITDQTFLSRGEQRFQRTLVRSNKSDDRIEGTVFEITPEELLLADEYEPDVYKRTRVTLGSGKEAWIYSAGHHLGY